MLMVAAVVVVRQSERVSSSGQNLLTIHRRVQFPDAKKTVKKLIALKDGAS